MSRFNLLDESWISVVFDDNGNTKEVSIKEIFENAHKYKGLAGEMETQDFAIMRVLLSVLHTVFSRFNAEGEQYGYFELNNRYKQIEVIDEDDFDDYIEELYETWFDLWEQKKFPAIINDYLEKWRDRFYLFDEDYPFFGVKKDDISPSKISKTKASVISGKNINRLISESGNKTALFSPKNAFGKNKEILNEAEIARWLITFQSYTGLSDKVIFGNKKYKSSKGWLFDLGGIYFKGDNLFETLMLNFMIGQKENDNIINIQKPCWEYESNEIIRRYFDVNNIDNISSLYTAWSRGIYIDKDIDVNLPFEFFIVKLPDINHKDKFIEPMTVWKYNEKGENKDTYTPKKHQESKALWRSFGMLTINDKNQRRPGIVDWINEIKHISNKCGRDFTIKNQTLCAVSMKDDGNATSWVPTDEIIDYLLVDYYVFTDLQEDGWIIRINEVVELTKKIVNVVYKNYILDIKKIRNIGANTFVNNKVEEAYYKIDYPFRQWLFSISIGDDKDNKIKEWKSCLKRLLILGAKELLLNGSARDYKGIEEGDKIKNIATSYNKFITSLNREI